MTHKPAIAVLTALAALVAAQTLAAKPPPPAAAPAPPAPPTDADMRTPDPKDLLIIETTKGRVLVELNDLAAPNTAERIRTLARQGVYDGRVFFRVIDNFMDQTGDPVDSGVGASSLPNLQPEFTFKRGSDMPFALVFKTNGVEEGFVGSLPVISQTMDLGLLTADHRVQAWGTYCPGVVGMARSDDPASGNSQFFLMRTNASSVDHATHALDKNYTAFGRVLAGQDVVDAIKVGEPVAAPQDRMISVKVVADLPEASRPKVRVVDGSSPWAKAAISRAMSASNPVDFSVCDVKLPVEVK
ncbi:MAG TPA: peptidylprolyl isomerase [Caulobacteraceae bacterium]|nr:peptidylprolyl isomerase [Caulobacteraceae bacterium]